MTRNERRLEHAKRAEETTWRAVSAHNSNNCFGCDFGATYCDEMDELMRAWNEAKRRRMLAEARALGMRRELRRLR